MRFGRQLHNQVVPEWATAYIDYHRFKSQLKLKAELDLTHSALDLEVTEAAADVEACYRSRLNRTSFKADLLMGPGWTLNVTSAVNDPRSTGPEFVAKLAECLELRDYLAKLRWYGAVNGEMLKRLRSKSRRSLGSTSESSLNTARSAYKSQEMCTALLDRLLAAISYFDVAAVRLKAAGIGIEPRPTQLGLLFFIKLYGRLPLLSAWESTFTVGGTTRIADTLSDQLVALSRRLLLEPSADVWDKDTFGRVPLHYAAQYGLSDICAKLLHHMDSISHPSSSKELLQDVEGYTPLQLAVAGGHVDAVEALMAFSTSTKCLSTATELQTSTVTDLLSLALRVDSPGIVALLLPHVRNINHRNKHGETALFVAARSGSSECVKTLLQPNVPTPIDPNISSGVRAWTPLIVASVHGHAKIADLLIHAGADVNVKDTSGWTAMEHAAYRGHLQIAETLSRLSHAETCKHEGVTVRSIESLPAVAEDIEIYVNLGPLNTRNKKKAVDLGDYHGSWPASLHPDTRFSVQVSAIGAAGSEKSIDLPLLEDFTNSPFKFVANPGSSVTLVFKIFLATAPGLTTKTQIGSALAFLDALKDNVAPKRESLIRDYTIPIVEMSSSDLIGSLTFNFLVVKPIQYAERPKLPIGDIFKPNDTTSVIGHRGFGANNPATKRLQIGENTVLGSHAATSLGASFIEFDVQLTSDHVPIIYHDNIVAETGVDVPPWGLSLDQFKFISKEQELQDAALPRDQRSRSPQPGEKRRSLSSDIFRGERLQTFKKRMKYTEDYQNKGFKANVRGNEIADRFATFEEFLKNVPEETGFDIELKYPMLWEAEDANMELYGVELNHYIDTILETVFAHAGSRQIFFSSFFPELCILCSRKQQTYPVLFLNDSGNTPTGDVRASNMQEGLKFAQAWNLSGIVVSSEPLVYSPKLIRHVQDKGLVCLSYGGMNNEPEKALIQVNAGLNAICVDEVGLIKQTVRGKQPIAPFA